MPGSFAALPVVFAQGQGAAAGGNPGAGLWQFLPYIVIIGLWFYLLLIRPQQKQKRERRQMLSAQLSLRAANNPPSNIRCPTCNSENCQRVAMVYEQGTHSTASVGGAVFLGDFGKAFGAFGATGSSQSSLAKRLSLRLRCPQERPVF